MREMFFAAFVFPSFCLAVFIYWIVSDPGFGNSDRVSAILDDAMRIEILLNKEQGRRVGKPLFPKPSGQKFYAVRYLETGVRAHMETLIGIEDRDARSLALMDLLIEDRKIQQELVIQEQLKERDADDRIESLFKNAQPEKEVIHE